MGVVVSKKSDNTILNVINRLKDFCEQDKEEAMNDAKHWRQMPEGGIATLPAGKDFIDRTIEHAEQHAASREIHLGRLEATVVGIGMTQEAAFEERSRSAKQNANKGGRPSLKDEALKIASAQNSRTKKKGKSDRAKAIRRELQTKYKPEDIPEDSTIRRWPIYDKD